MRSNPRDEAPAAAPALGDSLLQHMLALVERRRGIDFRDYRPETLAKRVESRMRARRCADAGAYFALLAADEGEVDRLAEALVIPVTGFFRDPEVFAELGSQVVPRLSREAGFLRVWVAGCATGEEAYSVAILLAEAARGSGIGFEVVASDVDQRSLEVAHRGFYPEAALAAVPGALRARYFEPAPGGALASASLRARVRFGRHDLVGRRLAPKEAIVASFELVLCRNLLMYFEPALRNKAHDRLAAVLEPDGALVIGPSESLPAAAAGRFDPYPGTSPSSGIFRRRKG